MNHLYKKIGYSAMIAILFNSCAKSDFLDFLVEKPQQIKVQEEIDSYSPLKSYLNKDANPNFKWGTAITVSDYLAKGVKHRLVNINFEELVAENAMKHNSIVQNDGSLNFAIVEQFIESATAKNMEIYGHALCWHSGQNASYLNSLIAPIVIDDNEEASLDPNILSNSTFENGIEPWGGWGNNSLREQSASGEGYDNTGYALKITNPSVVNPWEAQLAYDWETPLNNGEKYFLSLRIKGSKSATIGAGFQNPENYSSAGDFAIIPITTDWEEIKLETTIEGENAKRFLISYGDYDGTIYIDNIKIQTENTQGDPAGSIIEKTDEEKELLISQALETFIAGMMEITKDHVKAWDVVNEPMSDQDNGLGLKTGIGKVEIADDEFYWQDYLGKDYAVKAIQYARKYGTQGDKLFVNDYGLEGDGNKCERLITYIEYIESKGATVDGIGTQMHIDITTKKENIIKMYELLAASGKLVKISELDIGLGGNTQTPNATDEQYAAQAELYQFVVEKYFEIIPKSQQYGITIWSPIDSPNSEYSYWRKGEPVGLWTESFVRKPAFKAVAHGLESQK